MTYSIECMKKEHENISRMLEVIRQACIGILELSPVDVGIFGTWWISSGTMRTNIITGRKKSSCSR